MFPSDSQSPIYNFPDAAEQFLKVTNKRMQWSVHVIRMSYKRWYIRFTHTEKHSYYVVFIPACTDDYDAIGKLGEGLGDDSIGLTNILASYLIVVDEGDQKPSEVALWVIDSLSELDNVLDVLVLIPESKFKSKQQGTLNLYTRLPYHQSGNDIILLDQWIMEGDGRLLNNVDLFPKKVPKKISNVPPLKVGMLHTPPFSFVKGSYINEDKVKCFLYEGPEVQIVETVMKQINLSICFGSPIDISSSHIERLINAIVHVSIGLVYMVFGGMPLHDSPPDYLVDTTTPHFTTGDRWFVPCPKQIPRLTKISETFPISVWLLIGITSCLTTIVMWCSARRKNTTDYLSFGSISSCLYGVWAVILGVSVPNMPVTWYVRFVFCVFVWFAYIINTLFQTYFTSYLVDPGFYDQIRSFDELLASGLSYGYYKEAHKYYFYDKSDWRGEEMRNKGLDCSDYEKCLMRVIKDGDFATLRSELYADYFVKTNMPKMKNPICQIDDRFMTYYMTIYIRKFSPFTQRINEVMYLMKESGLIEKLRKDFQDNYRYQANESSAYYISEEDDDDGYFCEMELLWGIEPTPELNSGSAGKRLIRLSYAGRTSPPLANIHRLTDMMVLQTFRDDGEGHMYQFKIRNPGPEMTESKLFSTFCVNVKMQYTLNQRLFLVKQYWITNSITATQRAYQREFGARNPPKRNTILGLVSILETTGSLGYLKDRVYATRPQTLDDLKHNMAQEIQAIDNRVLQRVASNMERRVELCLMQDGGHFQHLL
ncbi:hypothetical protein ANN_13383 [Periplaneta americana]|uniref:DUF4817 domain-containing protein n=1 Tax=Periplaneta americana TaxID=6978 RepID=A0ABQ8TL95_PERAM|nr:hypothetical protein ANN_13383 [Periplaneta americana]